LIFAFGGGVKKQKNKYHGRNTYLKYFAAGFNLVANPE
jgi:hypothetical protein